MLYKAAPLLSWSLVTEPLGEAGHSFHQPTTCTGFVFLSNTSGRVWVAAVKQPSAGSSSSKVEYSDPQLQNVLRNCRTAMALPSLSRPACFNGWGREEQPTSSWYPLGH